MQFVNYIKPPELTENRLQSFHTNMKDYYLLTFKGILLNFPLQPYIGFV